MTNSAAPGGASSSCRGGDAHCGCGRNRTPGVSVSPDARRQWLTVAIAPGLLYLQADHIVLMCVLVLQRTFRARSRLQDVLPGEGIGVIWASPHSIQLKGSL